MIETVLKIGGSVLTVKSGFEEIRETALKNSISELRGQKDFILIHGAGSFGHPHVRKYLLKRKENLKGVLETHLACKKLNELVVREMMKNNLNPFPVHPFSSAITRNGKIEYLNEKTVTLAVSKNMIPVLHGDMVYDTVKGFIPLSGDDITIYIAQTFKATRVGMATAVEGVLDGEGNIIKKITPDTIEEVMDVLRGSKNDVTGGMKSKILKLIPLAEKGVQICIFSGLEKGNIKKFMCGGVVGTLITGE